MSRASRRVALWTAVLVALLAVPGPAVAGPAPAPSPDATVATWAVAPADTDQGKDRPHFAYTLAPGGHLTDAIAVANHGDAPITLRLYASDALTTATGGLDLLPAGQAPTDAGAWIRLGTGTVTLKPQQSATVPFTLTVPANATPGDHTAGIVTSLVTTADAGAMRLDRRLGSRVYLRVTGALAPSLTVRDVRVAYHGTLDPLRAGTATITYTVANTGNVRLQAHQHIRITGLLGAITQRATPPDLPEILPGNSLTRTVTVHNVWPTVHAGVTVSLATFAGTDDPPVTTTLVSGSSPMWAWPVPQLAVLVLVMLIAAGYVRLRRRRRDRVTTAISEAVTAALAHVTAQPPAPDTADVAPAEPPGI